MLMAILVVLVVTGGGFALTYLYDRDAPLLVRVATGFVTGIIAQGLMAFALALPFGLHPWVIALATLPLLSPLLIFRDASVRQYLIASARRLLRVKGRSRYRFPHLLLSLVLISVLLWVFRGVFYIDEGAIFTNNHQNYGDLPWHIALTRGFTVGGNYPPEHLQFAGSRLTYPYLNDFIVAEFTICGAELVPSFLLGNVCLALSLLALVQHWAFRLTRSPFALIVAPLLLFFNGGWGWLMLLQELPQSGKSLWQFLMTLPHDYTMHNPDYRWGDTLCVLFTTQRSILLGMPLAICAMTSLWTALRQPQRRIVPLVAAGVMTGMLPLAHTHTALVLLTVVALYALPELRHRDGRWRDWLFYFVPAIVLMAPQGLMLLTGTDAHTSHYFGVEVGWDSGGQNPILFWLRNTGPFLPLLALALFWRHHGPLIRPLLHRYYLPFTLWMLLPNLLRFAPWVWDNIKVLIYGYLASIPLVSLLLAHFWRRGLIGKVTSLLLLLMMILAGSIDVFRIASGQSRAMVYSKEDIAFGETVSQTVPPACRILMAPQHNHPVTLAGRRLLCGYGGHLWSHGFDYASRAEDVKKIYAGANDADALLERYKVQYIVVSPVERREPGFTVRDGYLNKFPIIVAVGDFQLRKVR